MKRLGVIFFIMAAACYTPLAAHAAGGGWDDATAYSRADLSQRVLDAHNRERARLGQPQLSWNAALAMRAAAWAQALADRGVMAHSDGASRPGEGENLWRGIKGIYSPEQMIGHFINERRDFRPGVFPSVSIRGQWEGVAHYTQIVWPTTREVGCAIVAKRGNDWLVCRYSPAGNVVGERVPR